VSAAAKVAARAHKRWPTAMAKTSANPYMCVRALATLGKKSAVG
jgi:hypothetical protein